MSKIITSKCWLGHESWAREPGAIVDKFGSVSAVLYNTRKDAKERGWKKPIRVEVSIKVKHD